MKTPDPHNHASNTVHDHDHDHHHGHDDTHHSHAHHAPIATENNAFLLPLMAITLFTAVEFVGGWWSHSLALLSDAWHMLFDVFALALAMWAEHQARSGHPASSHIQRKVSMVNALSMLLVTAWIVYESIARLQAPLQVAGGTVSIIAVLGLLVNLYVAKYMHHQHTHHGAEANLNHRAAFLHVLGDVLGSLTAVVAGGVIYFTGWMAIDPLLSIVISLLLLVVTLNLIRDIVRGHAAHVH